MSLIGDPIEYSMFPDQGTIIAQAIDQCIGLFKAFNFLDAIGQPDGDLHRRRGHARDRQRPDHRRDHAGGRRLARFRCTSCARTTTARQGQGHSGRTVDAGRAQDRRPVLRGRQRTAVCSTRSARSTRCRPERFERSQYSSQRPRYAFFAFTAVSCWLAAVGAEAERAALPEVAVRDGTRIGFAGSDRCRVRLSSLRTSYEDSHWWHHPRARAFRRRRRGVEPGARRTADGDRAGAAFDAALRLPTTASTDGGIWNRLPWPLGSGGQTVGRYRANVPYWLVALRLADRTRQRHWHAGASNDPAMLLVAANASFRSVPPPDDNRKVDARSSRQRDPVVCGRHAPRQHADRRRLQLRVRVARPRDAGQGAAAASGRAPPPRRRRSRHATTAPTCRRTGPFMACRAVHPRAPT